MSLPPDEEWDERDVRGPGARSTLGGSLIGFGEHEDDHDDSLADDVLAPPPEPGTFRPRRRQRRSPWTKLIALLLAAGLVVTGAVYAFGSLRDLVPSISFGGEAAPQDYEGTGTGEVLIEIPEGAGGGQIAEILVAEDVIASASAFTAAASTNPRAGSIQPGTYRMAEQMSSQAALDRLLDGSYREINGVTIREGLWVVETFEILAEATGHEVADYEAVDPADLDLPEAAEGELEGFLFPSTYEFAPDATPQQQLQMMIDTGKQVYADLEVPEDELRDVIIKASIVQGEGMFAEDLPKIARVIENRLEPNEDTNGKLQMDSTVHYFTQERGRAGTSTADRESDDPYNTYYHEGLPPGPINSPGADAIRAAMAPEEGGWLYFVTVDPSTGETNFAETWEEHQENEALFQEWCSENPDQC